LLELGVGFAAGGGLDGLASSIRGAGEGAGGAVNAAAFSSLAGAG
jgi:uncharacterized spore protein YtfJ